MAFTCKAISFFSLRKKKKKMANDNALYKPLNFMTFNIRLDYHENTVVDAFAAPPDKQDPFDPKEFSGEQPWSIRKWKIMDTILLYSPDVVALQAHTKIIHICLCILTFIHRSLLFTKFWIWKLF